MHSVGWLHQGSQPYYLYGKPLLTWKEPPGMFHDTAPGPGGSSQHHLAPLGSAPSGHNSCESCPMQGDNRRKSNQMQSTVINIHCCSLPPTDPVSPPSWPWGKKLAAAVRSAADGWCVMGTAGQIWHPGVGPVPASCPAAPRYLWPRD